MNHTCNFGNNSKNSNGNFVEALIDMFNTTMGTAMESSHTDSDSAFAFKPRLNVTKEENAYQLELLIPGAEKEDIKIAYDDKVLTVSYTKEKSDTKYLKKEFGFDKYQRKIRVRPNMDLDHMDAHYNNGILTLTIPTKVDVSKEVKEVSIK